MDTVDWRQLFLGFNGRINRALWWTGIAILWVVASINSWINRTIADGDSFVTIGPAFIGLVTFVIGIALIWPWLAVSVKRWHDRNKSGWWMLLLLIPIVGWIWGFVELGILEGTNGPNEYGPDPVP